MRISRTRIESLPSVTVLKMKRGGCAFCQCFDRALRLCFSLLELARGAGSLCVFTSRASLSRPE